MYRIVSNYPYTLSLAVFIYPSRSLECMIKTFLLQLLVLAYASVAVVSTLAYWPTIRDLYHHKKQSANVKSYFLWTICSAVGFLYSIFILDDLLVRITAGLGFACCAFIWVLSAHLELKAPAKSPKKIKAKSGNFLSSLFE